VLQCVLLLLLPNCLRLDYGDIICDGFYEPLGDFPEVVEKGNFPTLGQLRHVQSFEQDSREVRSSSNSSSRKSRLTSSRAMGVAC
jgi:hypothetical protein